MLVERKSQQFMSLKVKGLLAKLRTDGHDEECDKFCAEVDNLYGRCIDYIEKWMKPMEDFSCFKWITLSKSPCWSEVDQCVQYLVDKGIEIDDVKCFDQVCNLKKFVDNYKNDEVYSV
ncbi:hypothetical protein Pmani_006233 [Petrolisthes manimaculis]|uniref:Uncharacterized protein n=1 Tax=Petrolisthes manimaculis TaxID=1843537 RepID=A0AAE1QA90_9EUCA|nr:hypothetical protein Pmani_006233 [Petrolisthes manimaculis]